VPPLRREVEIEPRSDLLPEGFLLRRETEIHVSEASKKGILESWQLMFFAVAAVLCSSIQTRLAQAVGRPRPEATAARSRGAARAR
jgi:hypothetical protein